MSEAVAATRWAAMANKAAVSPALAPLAAGAIVLPVALAAIDSLPVGVVRDDGMYAVLAKSLATGQGYRWLNVPGAPPATHYPPGYPAVLSLLWRLNPEFPGNVMAFKALNALFLALAAASIVVLGRRLGLSGRAAAVAAIAGCLAVPTLVLSTLVMSEMLFLALLVPALLLADRLADRGADRSADDVADGDRDGIAAGALLGCVAAALMLVRTHGVAFTVAVAAVLVLRRRLRAVGVFVVTTVALMLPWQLWQASHRGVVPEAMRGDYESYGSWLIGGANGHPVALALRTLAATTRELFATMVGLSTAGLPTVALRLVVSLTAISLVIAGLALAWKRARTTAVFVGVYLAIIMLWPFTPGRFLWGIWPIIVVLSAAAIKSIVGWRPAAPAMRALRGLAAAGALLVLVGHGIYTTRGYRGRWWSSIGRQTAAVALPSVAWIGEHSRPGDIVATNAELMTYLYTGRQAVPATRFSVDDYFVLPSAGARADALRSILAAYPVTLVAAIANDSLEAATLAMAAQQPAALTLRARVPHGLIFSSMVR